MSEMSAETRRRRIRMRIMSLLAEMDEDGVGDRALATAIAYNLMPEIEQQIAAALTEAADALDIERDRWVRGAYKEGIKDAARIVRARIPPPP